MAKMPRLVSKNSRFRKSGIELHYEKYSNGSKIFKKIIPLKNKLVLVADDTIATTLFDLQSISSDDDDDYLLL